VSAERAQNESAVFRHHRSARFEWVASKRSYRIVWTETKVVRRVASGLCATVDEAWKDAATRLAAKK
jgi:hypothetical protein